MNVQNLMQMLQQAQGGNGIANIAQQLGISNEQAGSALEGLLPAFQGALQQNTRTQDGLAGLVNAVNRGKHTRYYDDPRAIQNQAAIDDGNAILGHMFGNKQVSRDVATYTEKQTGVGSGIIKKMLPIVAPMIMGAIAKQMFGNKQVNRGMVNAAGGAQGGLLGSVVGGLLGGGRRQARGGSAPTSLGGLAGMFASGIARNQGGVGGAIAGELIDILTRR